MEKDYKELIEFLGGKFEKIDQKFEKIDDQFEKVDQQFERVDQRFDKIERELENKADKEAVNEILTEQDKVLDKLEMLLQEKTIGDGQNKRQKKVLEIHNNALKDSKVLSKDQVSEIDNLRVF